MDLTSAERRQVRDGWRSLLYRMCPQLKEKERRPFTRKLLDHLCAYNDQFLDAFTGAPSTIDTERASLATFLREARDNGEIDETTYRVLSSSIRVRVRPGRLE